MPHESMAHFTEGCDPYNVIKSSGMQVEECKKRHNVDHLTMDGSKMKLVMHPQDGNGAGDNDERQRTEIKGSSKSPDGPLKAKKGDVVTYAMEWSPGQGLTNPESWFHVFQVKAKGKGVAGHPLYTLTLRGTELTWEDWYEDEKTVILDVKEFYNKFVRFVITIHYGVSNGWYRVSATDESGKVLKYIDKKSLKIWDNKMSKGKFEFVRPKTGIYHQIRKGRKEDETVFYNFISTVYMDKPLIPESSKPVAKPVKKPAKKPATKPEKKPATKPVDEVEETMRALLVLIEKYLSEHSGSSS